MDLLVRKISFIRDGTTGALFVACLTMFVLGSAVANDRLSCSDQDFNEKRMLLQAPNKAKRINQHVLEIKSATHVERFIDKTPHDELSGEHWTYCGYNKNTGIHLIGFQLEGLFSGKMLFEKSGQVLDAGHTVVFSPDRLMFLAVEQEDGMDGENWTLFDVTGKKYWSGYAGALHKLPGNAYDSVCAQFEHPHFTTNLSVDAEVVCGHCSTSRTVSLGKIDGEWAWRPQIKCN